MDGGLYSADLVAVCFDGRGGLIVTILEVADLDSCLWGTSPPTYLIALVEVFERLDRGGFCFPGVGFSIPGMGGAVKKWGGLDPFGVGQAWSFGVGMAWGPAVGGFILIVILVVLPLPLLLAVFMGPKCCVDLGLGLVQHIKLYAYNNARSLLHLHPLFFPPTLWDVVVLPVGPAPDGVGSSLRTGPPFF